MEIKINEKVVLFANWLFVFLITSLSAYSQEKLKLVWEDNFNNYKGGPDSIALPPNPDHWAYEIWKPGVVNQELQSYTSDIKNSRVQYGLLIVEAHKKGDSITSARINTNKSLIAKRQTGRIEFRAKVPAGMGTWPGLWLMPTDIFKYATTCSQELGWTSNCDAWPNSGEIDAMEHVGKDPNNIHFSVHTKNANFTTGNHYTQSKKIPTATTDFHIYAVELHNNRIDFYIDNKLNGSLPKPANDDWKDWPFDQPFYAIVNLAIGGSWGGPDVDDSMFPVKLEVDYIKMYEFVKD